MDTQLAVNEHLRNLVNIAGPYWAGESEVVWTYFHSPDRSKESDLLWLRRQCFKEIWGSGVGDKEKRPVSSTGNLSRRGLREDRS